MKIAVTYDNGEVFQHFGKTKQFKLYETINNKIVSSEMTQVRGAGHGKLGVFFKQAGVSVLICGGIGDGAKKALSECGIEFYGGVSGDADKQVEQFLLGNLVFDPNVKCSQHTHEHQ